MPNKTYILLHKNINVALFEVEDKDNIVQMRLSEKNGAHLPLGCTDISNTKQWLKNRSIPISRDHIKKDLTNVNLFQYMIENMGLSLTDHYWVKPVETDYTWETINAYSNGFKNEYSLDLHDDRELSVVGATNFAPSASLQGDLKKKWIINKQGKRILVKGNYSSGCLQSISEVFATLIHSKQGFKNHVMYKLIEIRSDGEQITGCGCENFTDLKYEFIPAIDIVNAQNKANHMSFYEHYINVSTNLGIDPELVRSFLEYQIMTDFLVTNKDRHFNNFGILRNSETLELMCPAPIFDTGNSLFYKSGYIPVAEKLLDIKVTSFLKKEVNMLKYVSNPASVDVSRLPRDNDLYTLLKKDVTITEEKRERIVRAYLKKIEYFSDFQNGNKIWQHGYK